MHSDTEDTEGIFGPSAFPINWDFAFCLDRKLRNTLSGIEGCNNGKGKKSIFNCVAHSFFNLWAQTPLKSNLNKHPSCL